MSGVALLVIDVQRGLFSLAEQPHDGAGVLSRIADLVARARAASVPVIYVQHAGGAGHPLERPLENWQFHPDIGYQKGDIVVEKCNCDAFLDTDLHQLLKDLSVQTIVATGMMSEYCVDTTCRRAFSLGYRVILVTDAHTTISKPHLPAEQIIRHHNELLSGAFVTGAHAADVDFTQFEAA